MVETILFLGLGSIGKRHLRNLALLAKQKEAEQPRFIVLRQSGKERPTHEKVEGSIVINASSFDEAFSYQPTIALICTPTALHVTQAIQAAQHHCHLFIEKPLSHNMNGIEELQHLVKKHDLIVMVGCVLRFHPVVKKVKDLLDQHAIGIPYHFSIEVGQYLPDWDSSKDYRESYRTKAESGGVVLELIHEIDYARFLFGEYSTIIGLTGQQSKLDIQAEDTAKIVARMRGAYGTVLGAISLDFLQRTAHRSMKIVGEHGTILADLNSGKIHVERSAGNIETIQLSASLHDRNAMYIEELRHFLDCVKNHQQTCISLEEGIASLNAALLVKQTAKAQIPTAKETKNVEEKSKTGCRGHCRTSEQNERQHNQGGCCHD